MMHVSFISFIVTTSSGPNVFHKHTGMVHVELRIRFAAANVGHFDAWIAHLPVLWSNNPFDKRQKSAVQIYRYRFSGFFKGLL